MRYLARRLAATLLVLLGVSVVTFGLSALIPGDPALILLGMGATEENLVAVRQRFGLDQPLPVRYALWLGHVVQGDLGRSSSTGAPVAASLAGGLLATLQLAGLAVLLAVLVAVPAGVASAVRRGRPVDHALTAATVAGLSVPEFLFGILLVLLFAVRLRWLPPSGYADPLSDPLGSLRYALLPGLAVAWRLTASLTRFVRASMLEVLRQPYMSTARAKGLTSWRVVLGHGLRSALTSVVTVVGLQFGAMFGGLIVVEEVFAWPGLGRLVVQAIGFRDYALLQGVVLVFAAAFSLVNLAVDLSYPILDPRIRYE